MDEWTLNDLLECSVCLERLDTSSKVLPCQHTFCRKCLEEIVSTHKELRCPECRILVDAQIDDLPPNVLLMRILEGIKNSGNIVPKKKNSSFQKQQQQQPQQLNFSQAPVNSETHDLIERNKCPPLQKQNIPLARAIYDYVSKEVGDLSFRKNDYILLHKKVNDQWCQGECDGKTGIFPLSYVQVILPFPTEVATCRALYDFRMVNDEEEGCLSFKKDEVITVIRRVDDNWGEGKLNDRIGIFPLAFVEMNDVAQALMKLPVNNQPGPSRMASLTPNGEESTPLIPTDHSVVSNNLSLHATNQYNATHESTSIDTFGTIKPIVSCLSNTFHSSSAVSSSTATPTSSSATSSTSSTSSSNTSSNSNSAPNSPPRGQQPQSNPNPFVSTSLQGSNKTAPQASHTTNVSNDALATDANATQSAKNIEQLVDTYCYWVSSQPIESSNFVSQSKEKRHSVSTVTSNMHSNKHSSDIINSESQDGQLNRHGSQRHKRTNNESMSGAHLPAGYVALYPYKPQKADELELKKGGYYLVTERCQDGWFKGFSVKTLKGGVFPGNYVILAKSVGVSGYRIGDGQPTFTRAQTPIHKPTHQQKTLKIGNVHGQLTVPKLPPRTSSPSARPLKSINHNSSTSWVPPQSDIATTPPVAGVVASSSNGKPQSSTSASLSFNSTSATSKPAEKVKEKKEKSGLIKRLAAIKRSKSPTDSASYSMDNPVFDDTSAGSHQAQGQGQGHGHAPTHGHSHTHPVHVRSGSCPSQLIAVKLNDGSSSDVRIASALVSARLKHRERPSISYANFTPATSRISVNNIASKTVTSATSNHKKSNSLDAADPRKPKQLVPTVRERFRCIVPYPPNSEYELELKVGDIIYVHRKREDGWYKGTQQRTGRTGLFPASFVETF